MGVRARARACVCVCVHVHDTNHPKITHGLRASRLPAPFQAVVSICFYSQVSVMMAMSSPIAILVSQWLMLSEVCVRVCVCVFV